MPALEAGANAPNFGLTDTQGRSFSLDQARADLRVVSADLARQYADNKEIGAGITPLLEDMVGRLEQPLFVLLGAVGAMLLIGCANLTNLLLARGLSRRREIAVRTALGASRGRLVEQSITELVPLLALGAAAGLLTATWVLRALVPVLPPDLPRPEGIGISLPVLGFTTLDSGKTIFTGRKQPSLFGMVGSVIGGNVSGAIRNAANSSRVRKTPSEAGRPVAMNCASGGGTSRSFAPSELCLSTRVTSNETPPPSCQV